MHCMTMKFRNICFEMYVILVFLYMFLHSQVIVMEAERYVSLE
jgi:hypothetical protein